ncbi:hypothetical protein ONQ60_26140, partial [Salmonella enterica subsp. enterica serovar Virginia]|nr:hypothetical protein [Salmonella enterica subsp. enterica serovar Virginia]
GTFWAPGDYNGALLMRIDHDLTAKVIQCDIQGHNGLAFSPNNLAHRAMLEQQAWIGLMDQARAEQGSEGLRTWWKNQSRKTRHQV